MTVKLRTRPPVYENKEELQEAIESYFNEGAGEEIEHGKDGEPRKVKKYTMTGLSFHLGFASRQSLYDYEDNEKFSYTIKQARMLIEEYYEKKLVGQNASGSIFALKNFGDWKDKQDIDLNKKEFSSDELKEMTDEELINHLRK